MAEEKADVKSAKLLAFAKRHTHTHFKTFDTQSALWRAEGLVDDAESLIELKTKCEEANIDFGYRFDTYSIVNYYGVGLVTCLEWHARSRRVDLLTFRPSLISKKDVESLDKVSLSQMMSEEVTVPYLLGAATTVSDMEGYVAIFSTLFRELGIDVSPRKVLQELEVEGEEWQEPKQKPAFDVLQEMYLARHQLVHEIDMSVVGAWYLRDMWPLERAVRLGRAVVACIRALEHEITKHAPSDFPNRINEEGVEEDQLEKLERNVRELEDKLDKFFKEHEEDYTAWQDALASSRSSAELEHKFLKSAEFLRPLRALDWSRAVRSRYVKLRYEYLKVLADEAFAIERIIREAD